MKKQEDEGFTLMEMLVTIGVTLVLGGILASVFSTGLKGTGRALAGSRTASQIAQTDRMIRECTNGCLGYIIWNTQIKSCCICTTCPYTSTGGKTK
jgi:Tfp pilus assembly protein PilE